MMMKLSRLLNPAVFFGAFILASVAFSSCYKEPFYKCKIIVTDTNSIPVPNAQVDLTAPVIGATVSGSGKTDNQGQIEFEFANEAVFDVTAVEGNRSGKGFVKLESREVISETVIIK